MLWLAGNKVPLVLFHHVKEFSHYTWVFVSNIMFL